MTGNDNQPIVSLFERCVTRREMLLTSGGALVGVLLVGCGGGGGQEGGEGEQAEQAVSGQFVGRDAASPEGGDRSAPRDSSDEILPQVVLFAIVADKPGAPGEERKVSAYTCDGSRMTEWFTGAVAGNNVELTSETGEAQLQAELTPDEVTGTFTYGEDEPIEFVASMATSIAGLYDVVITPAGEVSGMSWGGNELQAQLVERDADDGSGRTSALEGAVTLPDGETVEYSQSHGGTSLNAEGEWEPNGEYRYIVEAGGGGRGAKKGTPTTEGGGRSAQIIGKDMMC